MLVVPNDVIRGGLAKLVCADNRSPRRGRKQRNATGPISV